jgi:16S rRNA (guanine966-N2)-methyltransferase
MRIIAGKYRSRRILPPKNLPVRPTTDKARESLFNILNNRLDYSQTKALDLFAGTGAVSFEFISRGGYEVTAVDQNRHCVQWIRRAAGDFKMENLKVAQADVFRFVKQTPEKYDFIFADPPYHLENLQDISRHIFEAGILKENGWLVIEHPAEADFSGEPFFHSHRKYGKVNFSFFQFSDRE